MAFDVIIASRYHGGMIRSFRNRDTERVFHRERVGKFAPQLRRASLRKLLLLDAGESLDDLRVPHANRLEKLAGDREGQYSIRINDQLRVCFRWEEGSAYNVEIVDYH
ncbi:MAG: type II toxin-antitoxin system RelE/ParE family toxin [Gemmataceae bacterium]